MLWLIFGFTWIHVACKIDWSLFLKSDAKYKLVEFQDVLMLDVWLGIDQCFLIGFEICLPRHDEYDMLIVLIFWVYLLKSWSATLCHQNFIKPFSYDPLRMFVTLSWSRHQQTPIWLFKTLIFIPWAFTTQNSACQPTCLKAMANRSLLSYKRCLKSHLSSNLSQTQDPFENLANSYLMSLQIPNSKLPWKQSWNLP